MELAASTLPRFVMEADILALASEGRTPVLLLPAYSGVMRPPIPI